jgi:class 3 adenylate cyclase
MPVENTKLALAGAGFSLRTTFDSERAAGGLTLSEAAEVVTTGDGLLATFDAPAAGVRCATAIREAVRTLGLEIRVGLHAGEYKVSGAELFGLAFHIGARVAAKARAGEFLVSSAVKDLMSQSGIRFKDRGVHQLKGVPERWRLYGVEH